MLLRALAVTAVILLAVPNEARALDEGSWQVGVTGELTTGTAEKLRLGGGGRLDGRYGLTDALSAWAALGSVQSPGRWSSTRISSASGGLTLAFDVFRIVPFVGLGVAVANVDVPGVSWLLGGELEAGAEYLLDPKWSLGLVGIFQYLPLGLRTGRWEGRAAASLGLRLARSF
jgi:hypothetical protein